MKDNNPPLSESMPTLSKMKEDTNGNLTYDGDRLLVESDKTTTDIDFDTEINF